MNSDFIIDKLFRLLDEETEAFDRFGEKFIDPLAVDQKRDLFTGVTKLLFEEKKNAFRTGFRTAINLMMNI